VLELGLKILASYLLGAVNGSLLIGRLRGGIDIRKLGSGNAGATNALRTQGIWFALPAIAIDFCKGMIPVMFFPMLALPGVGLDAAVDREWLAVACGAAAVVGHCYPLWHRFSGGKGAATMAGVLFAIAPKMLLVVVSVWGVVILLTGYVGLATMTAGLSLPIALMITGDARLSSPFFILSIAAAAFIIFTHRVNIVRMRAGTEQAIGPITRSGRRNHKQ
jgi:glycerol-3-phosphate acyltransferase PlsY